MVPMPGPSFSSSYPPDPLGTRTPSSPMSMGMTAASMRTSTSTSTTTSSTAGPFPFATTSLLSQDMHTFNSSSSSLDPRHQPPLQREVLTYQLPVRMNGGKIVYITKTYTRARADPGAQRELPPKRPLLKRIIRFIKYGPVD